MRVLRDTLKQKCHELIEGMTQKGIVPSDVEHSMAEDTKDPQLD